MRELGRSFSYDLFLGNKVVGETGKTSTQLTIEKLLKMGYRGNSLDEAADPSIAITTLFDTAKNHDLYMDWQRKDGVATKYFKIISANTGMNKSKEQQQYVIEKFKGMGIQGDFIIAKSKTSYLESEKTDKEILDQKGNESFTEDDIPF